MKDQVLLKIKTAIESQEECVKPDTSLRVSSAGNCIRRMDYDAKFGAPPLEDHDWLRFETGKKLHEMWNFVFAKAYGSDFDSINDELELTTSKGLKIPGHPDGRIKSENMTVEFKNVAAGTYEMVENNKRPLDEHIQQANLYAHAMGCDKMLLLYYNKNYSRYQVFVVDYDITQAMFNLEKFDIAKDNRDKGIISPRPYADKTESPCFFCPHSDRCYEGFQAEVGAKKVAVIKEGQPVISALDYVFHRQTRLETEKKESKTMDSLIKELYIKQGLKEARIYGDKREFLVQFRAGKNDNLIGKVTEIKGDSNE